MKLVEYFLFHLRALIKQIVFLCNKLGLYIIFIWINNIMLLLDELGDGRLKIEGSSLTFVTLWYRVVKRGSLPSSVVVDEMPLDIDVLERRTFFLRI